MTNFTYKITDQILNGALKYSQNDGLALVYKASQDNGSRRDFSFAKTLSLWFEPSTGILLYVDGYCPLNSWIPSKITPPDSQKGQVTTKVEDYQEEIASGAAIALEGLEEAEILYDSSTGWVRVGEASAGISIEIAQGIVIGLTEGSIKAVWLRPSIED